MTIRHSILLTQKQAKITNATLCDECGISKSSYSLYKNGVRSLPYNQLQKVVDYLGLELININRIGKENIELTKVVTRLRRFKKTNMKKTLTILAITATLFSCQNNPETTENQVVDSVEIQQVIVDAYMDSCNMCPESKLRYYGEALEIESNKLRILKGAYLK